MRLPTFGKPRVISSAEFFPKHIALPRGSLDAILTLLSELGVKSNLQDERNMGTELNASFLGELSDQQKTATEALLRHDIGVLAASTAFGKTVVAANIIAARCRNTLVLVHRRQLLDPVGRKARSLSGHRPTPNRRHQSFRVTCPSGFPAGNGSRATFAVLEGTEVVTGRRPRETRRRECGRERRKS